MAREVCAVLIHSYSRFGVPSQSLVCVGVWYGLCVLWCGVESIPIVVLHTSCVNTYEGCLERPAVLKEEDIPILKQTAIHP